MKLKTATRINTAFIVITVVLLFPVYILKLVLNALVWPLEKLLELDTYLCLKVGNMLLKKSDEVKTGQICNQRIIRTETARRANAMFENEKMNKNV